MAAGILGAPPARSKVTFEGNTTGAVRMVGAVNILLCPDGMDAQCNN
jgi:hypothetical protein